MRGAEFVCFGAIVVGDASTHDLRRCAMPAAVACSASRCCHGTAGTVVSRKRRAAFVPTPSGARAAGYLEIDHAARSVHPVRHVRLGVDAGFGPRVGASESRAARAAHARLDDALAKKSLSFGSSVYVRIFKEEAELEVWLQNGTRYELFKTYPICALSDTLGPKEREGDSQSPEGFYGVTRAELNPESHYHLAFDIGYPNAYDRSLGRTGSQIMVHGNCVSVGCFAMTDEGIEEIYSLADAALAKGQASIAVHVFPFRMTDENTKRHTESTWAGFWADLSTGYDAFEATHVPPDVGFHGGHYFVRMTKS